MSTAFRFQTGFRWFGPDDPVPLAWLRQMTPCPVVVTHLPHVPPGEVWTREDLTVLRDALDRHDLGLGPIESLFWSDAMKLGSSERDRHIENYIQSLATLSEVFPDTEEPLIVTYNLMPLDWSRTNLAMMHENGARGLAFDQAAVEAMDLSHGLFLPGWGKGYSQAEFERLRGDYAGLGEEGFWASVKYVLDAVLPAAEQRGIRLAAHPNDPPWATFGLPAVLCGASGIRRLLSLSPSPMNALCFCVGSYGADPQNDVPALLREFRDSLAWVHLRTVATTAPKCFHETDHADPDANVDLLDVVKVLREIGFAGVFRADHGLDILHETEAQTRGYPAIDRYAANKMLWAYARALGE